MTLSTVSHDTFVIERSYDAQVAQVYEAWAEPKLKARWFAGSAEALGAGYDLDFRVGGREVNRGGPPGGPVYSYQSEFHDIVPERRIIYTYEMYADEARISVSVAGSAIIWARSPASAWRRRSSSIASATGVSSAYSRDSFWNLSGSSTTPDSVSRSSR